MIDKKEIEDKSNELEIHTSNVQRDYVFGWLLSGIYRNENNLRNKLILKGGNCFRKAYFQHARFSNDLDFSTQTELDLTELKNEINKACEYAGEKTGISFAIDKNIVAPKRGADEDNKFYEARVYFKGFYGEESYFIKVKLDVKEFDKIFLPLQTRNIIHSYSDAEECKGEVTCLKLEELLASKLDALLRRRHSPDLYDFIYSVFFQNVLKMNKLEVVKTFLKKTIHEPNPVVAKNLLLGIPFQTLKGFWDQYLVCPKQSLINFEEAESKFRLIIPELFLLFQPQPAYAFSSGGYTGGIYGLNYFPTQYRNVIMEAGQLRKILRMVYDNLERLVEPYSLTYKIRKDGVGREYFYGWDRTGGRSGNFTIKMYTADKVQSVNLTDETFEPRFPIELSRAGEISGQTYFSEPFSSTPRTRTISPGIRRAQSFSSFSYTIQCPVCLKKFKRSSYNTKLKKHKDSFGNRCHGSHGYIV